MKTGLLVILLCGFIIYLTALHRHKKNRMYIEQQLQRERFNQQLLQSKIEVQEATFSTVATELHDNVGQLISSALMMVNMAERELPHVPEKLGAAGIALDKAIVELRSISKSLHKDWLQQFNLEVNLRNEIDRLKAIGHLSIETNFEIFPLLLPDQQFMLFRVIQEGLQNILRHAQASHIYISFLKEKHCVKIIIRDNGTGFHVGSKTTGIGIQNMMLRIKLIGGRINWCSDTTGTSVNISIPNAAQT